MLPAEPDRFPEGLFEDMRLRQSSGPRWWVIHTRSRQEKCLARHLHRARTPFYLPLIARRHSYVQHGMMTSHVPLFPGYLFLLANHNQHLEAISIHAAVRSLDVRDQEEIWNDLCSINQLILAPAAITVENQLVSGPVVEIPSGPLAGLRGRIIRSASGGRLVVEIQSIRRGASVALDESTLATVE